MFLGLVGVGLLIAACSSAPEAEEPVASPAPTIAALPTPVPPEDYPEGSIAAILRDDGRFLTFLELSANVFVHTDVPRLLNMEREYTVFAPTDEAFAAIPPELLDLMRSDPEVAEEMFFHHHVPERNLRSEDFELLKTWPTGLTPRTVEIRSADDGLPTTASRFWRRISKHSMG